MGTDTLKHDCIRCGTRLLLGENFLQCCLDKHYYICRDCDNIKKKLNVLKKKAKLGTLTQRDLANLKKTEALQGFNSTSNGDVYIVTNPAFKGWVKVGMSLQADNRLGDYQTCSPFRDYVLEYYITVNDRFLIERKAHKALAEQFTQANEWFECSVESAIGILKDLLHEQDD